MDKIKSFQQQSAQTAQFQKMSQKQIQAVKILSMSEKELREYILNTVKENPALEIVYDPLTTYPSNNYSREELKTKSDDYQKLLENQNDNFETLQHHLMEQINCLNLSTDELSVCKKLIYNLDKDGFYGSSIAPENLLDYSKPSQNKTLLKKCISLIQKLDPIGTCCIDIFESLKVQAEINNNASKLTLFILDGHLDLLNTDSITQTVKNIKTYQKNWHSKAFAKNLLIDELIISEKMVSETISYIRTLNPHPAADYNWDNTDRSREQIDVAIKVDRVFAHILSDDFSFGKIKIDDNEYLQIKYTSNSLPEIRIINENFINKKFLYKAKDFLGNLQFRENSMILQSCCIVKKQIEFFKKGPGNIVPLTREEIANELQINTSTVSRFTSKKNCKYLQTEWGVFPTSYFFSSGVNSNSGQKISAEKIKSIISNYLEQSEQKNITDEKITKYLNSQGIQISRRTTAKYRQQMGVVNSYKRKK